MSQSKEDIARALAALAGQNPEPSEAIPSVAEQASGASAQEAPPPRLTEADPKPAPKSNPPSSRPARPEAPVSRPASSQGTQRPAQPKPAPTPQIAKPTSNRPERPMRPVKPTTPAGQSSGLSSAVEIAPPGPSERAVSATDEFRLRSLRSTLALRQLFIPSCLVLGATLPLLAIAWFVLRAVNSPMVVMKLPVWAVAVVAVAGLFFAGLSVLFILSVKTLNQQISELDDTAHTA